MPASTEIVVIGGGISGLATAGLLARDGHQVTILEQGTDLGGRAGRWASDGFTFDTGPSWYLMPEVIDHWFRLMGSRAASEMDLVRLSPAYRTWFEGYKEPVEVHTGRAEAMTLFDSMDPGSGEALGEYLDSAEDAYTMAKRRFLYDDFSSLRGMLRRDVLSRGAKLAQLLAMPLGSFVARRFTDPRQRQILGYPAVFLGSSPFKTPAMYHLMSHLDLQDGVLYPQGGFISMIDAMERLVVEAGVEIIRGASVQRILTRPVNLRKGVGAVGSRHRKGAEVVGVSWTGSDRTEHVTPAGKVVGALDLHHLETEMLPEELRTHPKRVWKGRDPGPSAVLVCLGVRGELPQLTHHNLFFTSDWEDNFGRIEAGEDLGERTSIYLSQPSASDPSVAPEGDQTLFILVPAPAVPSWGNGGFDGGGSTQVEKVADAAIDQIEKWAGIDDLRARTVVRRTYGPADFADSVNAWRGSALGAAHTLKQSAFLRPGIRSKKVSGLFYVGSSVRPGIGVPMCLISAELVLKASRGDRSPGPVAEPGQRAQPGLSAEPGSVTEPEATPGRGAV